MIASTMDSFAQLERLLPAGFPVVLVDRTFGSQKYSSVSVSNFQPIYRSVCRLAGRGKRRIGIVGGLPRLSTTKERIAAYQAAMADCGLPQEEALIVYGDSMENSAPPCLDQLLERGCDAILVCQGLMASVTIAYLRGKDIQPRRDLELVSFVDYDTRAYEFYYDQVDRIIQPVEELGEIAGEQILLRLEKPDAPVVERVLTSEYRPCGGEEI